MQTIGANYANQMKWKIQMKKKSYANYANQMKKNQMKKNHIIYLDLHHLKIQMLKQKNKIASSSEHNMDIFLYQVPKIYIVAKLTEILCLMVLKYLLRSWSEIDFQIWRLWVMDMFNLLQNFLWGAGVWMEFIIFRHFYIIDDRSHKVSVFLREGLCSTHVDNSQVQLFLYAC